MFIFTPKYKNSFPMTRQDQVRVCKLCTNRKMDINQGILCNLTGEKATFTDECKDFIADGSVHETQITKTIIGDDIKLKVTEKEFETFKSQQNLSVGILSSILVGTIGSLIWASITVATGYQIGYMALAIGAGVGYTMQLTGKGIDQIFGISGAIIAVLSCFLGNFFSLIGFVANENDISYLETLLSIDYSLVPNAIKEGFSFMDLFFYAIAGAEGYKFSFRKFTNEDIQKIPN